MWVDFALSPDLWSGLWNIIGFLTKDFFTILKIPCLVFDGVEIVPLLLLHIVVETVCCAGWCSPSMKYYDMQCTRLLHVLMCANHLKSFGWPELENAKLFEVKHPIIHYTVYRSRVSRDPRSILRIPSRKKWTPIRTTTRTITVKLKLQKTTWCFVRETEGIQAIESQRSY